MNEQTVWQTASMVKTQLTMAFQIGQLTWKELILLTDRLQFNLLNDL